MQQQSSYHGSAGQEHERLEEMAFLSHFRELRRRLKWVLLAIALCFVVAFLFSSQLIEYLKFPLKWKVGADVVLGFKEVTEPFMVSLQLSLLTAIIVSSPVWMYHLWMYIKPALYIRERWHMMLLLIMSNVLFITGALFCFWIILPLTLEFLINWGREFSEPDITIGSYISFLTLLIFGFGLVFEIPLILVVMSMMGILTSQDLSAVRKYVILLCFVLAALLTPPDWLSQIGMAIPVYVMYEMALVVIRVLEKKRMGSPSTYAESSHTGKAFEESKPKT